MGLVAFCLGRKSYTDAESDQKRNPSECAAKKSSGIRTPQHKISHLAEFFGVIFGVDGHGQAQIPGNG
jgi:hypothetical protein